MKSILRLFILLPLLLGNCQSAAPKPTAPLQTVTIPDGKNGVTVNVTVTLPRPSIWTTLGNIGASLIPFL